MVLQLSLGWVSFMLSLEAFLPFGGQRNVLLVTLSHEKGTTAHEFGQITTKNIF